MPQTRINLATSTPRDSYRTTGAFLAWVERQHPGTVRSLNAPLRESRYHDSMFQDATSKPLEDLWREFIIQWRDT